MIKSLLIEKRRGDNLLLGTVLGLPGYIVWCQPFAGARLGIRVLGEVAARKLHIVCDDARTYDYTVGLCTINSADGMISDRARINWEI